MLRGCVDGLSYLRHHSRSNHIILGCIRGRHESGCCRRNQQRIISRTRQCRLREEGNEVVGLPVAAVGINISPFHSRGITSRTIVSVNTVRETIIERITIAFVIQRDGQCCNTGSMTQPIQEIQFGLCKGNVIQRVCTDINVTVDVVLGKMETNGSMINSDNHIRGKPDPMGREKGEARKVSQMISDGRIKRPEDLGKMKQIRINRNTVIFKPS